MSEELREILADGEPVSKARLRDYLSRTAGASVMAEGFGLTAQTRPLPVPDEDVQAANHAAIMAALRAVAARGGGAVVLPAGFVFVNDTIDINSAALGDPFADDDTRKRLQVNILGAGRRATKLVQNHPTRPLIRVLATESGPTRPTFELRLESFTLLGRGAGTTGNLVELYSWINHVLDDLWIEGTAGCGIHISGAERIVLRDVVVYLCRQALMMHDAVNESYLFNFLPLGSGVTIDPILPGGEGKAWGPNIGVGGGFVTSGPVIQAKRAGVHIEGSQNVRWIGGSCKAMPALAGLKIRNCENAQVDHVYFEGFPHRDPGPNPSVIIGGAMEKTWLTAPVGAADRAMGVEDSSWFPRRYSTFEAVERHRTHVHPYAIYNPANPREYEIVGVLGFVDDEMHVLFRGMPGGRLRLADAPARAWPAGSAVTELSFGLGDVTLHGNHLEGFSGFQGFPKLELVENWERGDTNGQVIAGFTFDDFCSEPNFPGADLPGSCHLELTGHNRVRVNRQRGEGTGRVQVHHRALVYLSQESQFGGLTVEQASSFNPRWMTVSRALSDHEPLLVTEPGGAMNVRHDETFTLEEADDATRAWRPVFVAPFGTVAECRLYSVRPDSPAYQGHDFVASFVVDTAGSWPPEVAIRYLRGRNDLTPHLRLRHFGKGRAVAVELGLARAESVDRRPVMLRFDATAICGRIEEGVVGAPAGAQWLFPLAAARALDLAQVSPVPAPQVAGGNGGELFVENGELKYRGPAGTVTVIAPR